MSFGKSHNKRTGSVQPGRDSIHTILQRERERKREKRVSIERRLLHSDPKIDPISRRPAAEAPSDEPPHKKEIK